MIKYRALTTREIHINCHVNVAILLTCTDNSKTSISTLLSFRVCTN